MKPTETTNYPTYTVTMSNGDALRIHVEVPCVTKNLARVIAQEACSSFRDVQVVNNDTGEVEFHQYVSDEWWKPKAPSVAITETIANIKALYDLGAN